ncbi:MAG: nucleotidyltransferase family protein [bacterium]
MSINSKEEIYTLLNRNRNQIRHCGVKRIGLFGSFVRGEQSSESDVDFLVDFHPGEKTFENFIRLAFLLEDLLGRRVELVTSESVSPYLQPYISAEVEYAVFSA